MTEDRKIDNDLDDWPPCESGEIRSMVDRVRMRRRNRITLTGACAALLLVAFGFFGAWSSGLLPPTEPSFGGVACSEVRRLGEQYMMGTLDEATAWKIRAHLEQCPECPRIFEQMRASMHVDNRFGPAPEPISRSLVLAGFVQIVQESGRIAAPIR
ncbi:MAG: zf-HC2 domain-containing protein [Planctomycetales bacterium]